MPTYSKHSKKPRMVSRGSSDKRPMKSQHGMGRKVTKEAYEAREIIDESESRGADTVGNKRSLDRFQSTLKPIRSSQKR